MPRETIILRDKGTRWRLKAAVCVLAWLAYPAATDEDRRRRIKFEQNALAAWFRRRAIADPVWAMRSCKMPPALLFATAKEIPKVLERAEKLLFSRRLPAGYMLGTLVTRDAFKHGPLAQHPAFKRISIEVCVRVEGQSRPASLNMLASEIAEIANNPTIEWQFESGGANRTSVIRRIWSPSKPVAHLALALLSHVMQKCEKTLPQTLTLLEGGWLEPVLLNAEMIRQLVVSLDCPSIKIAEADTVRLLFRTMPPTDDLVVAK
jgi:hypothetical protein